MENKEIRKDQKKLGGDEWDEEDRHIVFGKRAEIVEVLHIFGSEVVLQRRKYQIELKLVKT